MSLDRRGNKAQGHGARRGLAATPELCGPQGGPTHLCQLLGFVVERIHYFAHVLNRLEGSLVSFVYGGFIEDDQDTLALVKDSCGHKLLLALGCSMDHSFQTAGIQGSTPETPNQLCMVWEGLT